jgi:hypothetical protein
MSSFMRLLVSLFLSASMVYATDEPTLSPAEQKVANMRARAQGGPAESRLSGTEQELIQAAQARQRAYAHGDCAGWALYVSDDFRFIDQAGHSFTRDQEMKECQLPLTTPPHDAVQKGGSIPAAMVLRAQVGSRYGCAPEGTPLDWQQSHVNPQVFLAASLDYFNLES